MVVSPFGLASQDSMLCPVLFCPFKYITWGGGRLMLAWLKEFGGCFLMMLCHVFLGHGGH